MTNTQNSTDAALTLEYFSAYSDACILDLAAWLQAKYGDRFATFDEYVKIVNDPSHGRNLVWAWATHQYAPEIQGFLAGWGYCHDDERWEERQAEILRREPLLTHEVDPVDYDEPDIDDSVRCCPECETPNQFGEVCGRCRREIQEEGRFDLEVD